jgi:hypothetical protein
MVDVRTQQTCYVNSLLLQLCTSVTGGAAAGSSLLMHASNAVW